MTDQAPSSGFQIVKEILQNVARFQTPATPEVYEVWYQYVMRQNEPLVNALDYAIAGNRPIDGPMLLALREQFCKDSDEAIVRVQSSMATELIALHSIVEDQKEAGSVFEGSLQDVTETINQHGQSEEQLSTCVATLTVATTRMSSQLNEMSLRLEERDATVASLRQQLAESQRGMLTDPMTGTGNRRYFERMLRQVIDSNSRAEVIHCLALIDLDGLKSINDTFGHEVGDRVICHMGCKLKSLIPHADHARLGGDEFAIFLRTDSQDVAVENIEEFRRSFAARSLRLQESEELLGNAAVSVGVAFLRTEDDEASWYKRADKLLYRAKELGGNRVVSEQSVR